MCPKPKVSTTTQKVEIAPTPAAPLGVADEPDPLENRRRESIKNYGSDTPKYRRKDDEEAAAPAIPSLTM